MFKDWLNILLGKKKHLVNWVKKNHPKSCEAYGILDQAAAAEALDAKHAN